MTTKYQLTSLLAENCAVEIHSKMHELCFFQLKTHRLSTLFYRKTQKQKNTAKKQSQKNFFFISLPSPCANINVAKSPYLSTVKMLQITNVKYCL